MPAFDPKYHDLHPETGFQIDKETGRMVGLVPAPISKPMEGGDYPKWVVVHESHVMRKHANGAPDHISVPMWPEFHVNRVNGEVTVLVLDAEEEAKAAAASVESHSEGEDHTEEM